MTSWKTTTAALIGALIIALQTIMNTLQNGVAINWYQIALSFAIAALGIYSQDILPKKGNTNSKNVQTTTLTSLVIVLFISPLTLTSCASTQTALVSGTLSNGDKFPLCLEVTQKSPVGGVTLLAAFCANAQIDIDNKAAQYKTMYGPKVTITELMGPEKRQLN